MDFKLTGQSAEKIPADLIFITLFEKGALRQADGGTALDKLLEGNLSRLLRDQSFEGKEGETLCLPTFQKIKPKYVLVVGLGEQKKFSTETVRRLGGRVCQEANKLKVHSVGAILEPAAIQGASAENRLRAFAEGSALANYQFIRFKTRESDKKKNTLQTVWYCARGQQARLHKAVQQAQELANGVNFARDLTNLPPNYLNPTTLGYQALDLAKQHKNISVKVWTLAEIKKQKMGALLAVAQGANTPPAFIHLKYKPAGRAKTKVALVGKGITFDSGGLNIKTREMEEMKMDMAGAAAVLGTFKALAQIRPNVTVEGFIPAAENMPAGNACRPSDIITTRSGKTVEIINTDAEGRLVLADALDFASEMKPTYMIDMATLTGGAAYALGELYTPVLGNDQRLVERLLAAGKKAGEPAWELPMIADYKKGYLKTPADIKNSGSGTKSSTIAGALFLEEFVQKNKWVHMDIAYTAWAKEPTAYHPMIGATGTPVRTLLYFLMDL